MQVNRSACTLLDLLLMASKHCLYISAAGWLDHAHARIALGCICCPKLTS
jgi:hypothetical protein